MVNCPKCGQKQFCPCKICHKVGRIEWVELPNDIIACGRCGYKQHIDWWQDESIMQFNNP